MPRRRKTRIKNISINNIINNNEASVSSNNREEMVSESKPKRKLMIPIRAKQKLSSTFVDASGKGILSVSPKSNDSILNSPTWNKGKFSISKNQISFNNQNL